MVARHAARYPDLTAGGEHLVDRTVGQGAGAELPAGLTEEDMMTENETQFEPQDTPQAQVGTRTHRQVGHGHGHGGGA